ncbi:MAG: DNA translocase FtsK [Lachnospiraceae bacterium]|jgi:S-DNA-T family DNA segregation ATPase FtsK/SpoIIIE
MSTGSSRQTKKKAAVRQSGSGTARNTGRRTETGSRKAQGKTRQSEAAGSVSVQEPVRREVSILVAGAVLLLLLLSVFGVGGVAGDYIRMVLFGLTGVLAYVLPFAIGAALWYGMSCQFPHVARVKIISGAVGLAAIDGLISRIWNVPPISGTPVVEFYTDSAQYLRGGGLIGGLFSLLLSPLGTPGTIVIEIVVILICLVLITGQTIRSRIEAGRRQAREAAKRNAQEREDYREYADRRAEERLQARQNEREMQFKRQVSQTTLDGGAAGSGEILGAPQGEGAEVPVYDQYDSVLKARKSSASIMRQKSRNQKLTRQEKNARKLSEREKQERMRQLERTHTGIAGTDILPPPEPLNQDMHEILNTQESGGRILGPEPMADASADASGETASAAAAEPEISAAQRNQRAADAEDDEWTIQDLRGTEPQTEAQEKPAADRLLKTDYRTPVSTETALEAAGAGAAARASKEAKQLEAAEAAQKAQEAEKEAEEGAARKQKPYTFPPLSLLKSGKNGANQAQAAENQATARKLQQTLQNFGVQATITNIACGPAVTRYEIQPEMGVKVSKIVSLSDDIKLNLAAADIRIEAPIPGKAAIGIEVPNKAPSAVMIRDIFESEAFRTSKSPIAFAVGKDLGGKPVVADIAKMPHLLIAGATGSGKSVCINSIIVSILYHATPQQVRMILVDPKVVELNVYSGIPHLLLPVVTDPKKASGALNWAVAQMDERYRKFAKAGAKNLKDYNAKVPSLPPDKDGKKPEKLPQLLIIIDELADLMMVAPGEVEQAIIRLAQLARAAGIHLIIATQRPSVNVITGLIKANVPSRIAFAVSSGVDSRTIIDMNGAEKLLGKGDMLFFPTGYPKPKRVQGTFVSDEEVTRVVEYVKAHNAVEDAGQQQAAVEQAVEAAASPKDDKRSEVDELFEEAGRFLIKQDHASTGSLQRNFRIGFNRAGRIMDQLAAAGVVTEGNGTKAREVLMNEEQFEEYLKTKNS